MDRMRMAMTSLLAGVALLGAGATCAQGRDPFAATLRARAQQPDESPAAQARRLEEKLAWLYRLVGQFHATSVYTPPSLETWSSLFSVASAGSWSSATPAYVSPEKLGRAECVAIGAGTEVSCLLDLRTPRGERSVMAIRLSLPMSVLDEMGDVRQTEGSLRMGTNGGQTMNWVSLQGDAAIFRTACAVPGSGVAVGSQVSCRDRVSITARPDGTRVRISIDSPTGSLFSNNSQTFRTTTGTTTITLNRPRQYREGEGAGRRSGQ